MSAMTVEPQGVPIRVLLVDDAADIRALLKLVLEFDAVALPVPVALAPAPAGVLPVVAVAAAEAPHEQTRQNLL